MTRPWKMSSATLRSVGRVLKEAALPGTDHDGWMPGFNVQAVFRGKVVLLVVIIITNLLLLGSMRANPDLDYGVARFALLLNDGFLVCDLVLAVLFLRRWSRWYPFWFVVSLSLDLATIMVWAQVTGSVTSYFLGAIFVGILVVRVTLTYRIAVAVTVIASVSHAVIYFLELRGVLPYAPIIKSDGQSLYASLGFREMAASALAMTYPVAFLSSNFYAKIVRKQRNELEQARLELRRAVDKAKLGRLSGTRLGDYAVEDLLGRGGMGEVYAAKRQKDGKQVAIKLLHAHLGDDQEMRARFRREAEVVRKMPKGTVAAVYEFGTNEDGYDYIVMEQLRGEDLGAFLRRRERLEPGEVLAIVDGVAAGLDAAHALGVVHRDLKPQNVFLCGEPGTGERPDVRLLDFGVARLHEAAFAQSMTATAAVIGTPGYMPPEQAGGGVVGPPADIFALGAIVYRAITGKPAFPSRSAAGALFEALHYDPSPPSEAVAGLHPDVDAVLALALAKDPAIRYQRASELARDLAAAVRGELAPDARTRAAKLVRAAPVTAGTMTAG